MGYFGQAGVYLVQVIFGLYILAVMLRFLFQLLRVDFYNPISQTLVKITNPPLIPLRRIIPGLMGIDLASVTLLLLLQALEIFLTSLLMGTVPNLLGVAILAFAYLLQMIVYIFIFTIIIRIVLSWVNPMGGYNPFIGIINSLTEPIMAPARRLIPPMSGLDLSPIAVFILLQLTVILMVQPLKDIGQKLLFG